MINAATHSATLEDVPQLVRMMEEFYDEAGFPLDHGRASDGFSALLADRSRGAIWIVFEDAQPAGYAVLTLRFSMEHGGLDAFIDDLFIRPPHRRRGLGRLVLQALFHECRKRGVLAVQCRGWPRQRPSPILDKLRSCPPQRFLWRAAHCLAML